jgi:hypothetical protein
MVGYELCISLVVTLLSERPIQTQTKFGWTFFVVFYLFAVRDMLYVRSTSQSPKKSIHLFLYPSGISEMYRGSPFFAKQTLSLVDQTIIQQTEKKA